MKPIEKYGSPPSHPAKEDVSSHMRAPRAHRCFRNQRVGTRSAPDQQCPDRRGRHSRLGSMHERPAGFKWISIGRLEDRRPEGRTSQCELDASQPEEHRPIRIAAIL
jgi:hypothetical protein